MTKSTKLLLLIIAVAGCGFCGGNRPANAGFLQVLPLTGTDWTATVTWADAGSTLFWIPTPGYAGGAAGKGSAGTLNKLALFDTNDPIAITFEQTVVHRYAGGSASTGSGPLRFIMNASIVNQTTDDWNGFLETITPMDPAAVDDSGSTFHPTLPHFHPSGNAADYTPLTRLDNANPAYTLALGNGIVSKGGGVQSIFNLLVHEVEFEKDSAGNDLKRKFVITEQPVALPEPTTAAMAGIAAALLAGYWGRKRWELKETFSVGRKE